MKPSSSPSPFRALGATAVALLVAGAASPSTAVAQDDPDFLFGAPRMTVSLEGGYAVPFAGSDVFDLVRKDLTLETSDFSSPTLGLEMAYRLNERFDLAVDFAYTGSESHSEFREWVDMNDLPIKQVTRFKRLPLTLSLRTYLWDRGRSVGRFAWIPRDWTPYVGIGGGVVWWKFAQEGDFVDFETLEIFTDHFTSSGAAGTVHALAGVEMSLGPRFALTAEGRYSWAEAEMDRDFVGFEPIDLSGLRLTVGVTARLAKPGG